MSDEKKPPHSLAAFLRGPAPASGDARLATTAAAENVQADAHAAGKLQAAWTPPPIDSDRSGTDTPTVSPSVSTDGETTRPPPDTPQSTPSFIRASRTTAVRRRTLLWQWLLAATLLATLAVQVLVADRARLAADADWRPLLATLCGALRCELPAWHQPAAFRMLDREVRPATGRHGVLQVQASFRNEARWAQAWPRLQLSLSDADGRVIGSRVFSPQEYLGHPVAPGDTLAPGQGAQISFRVQEPTADTAAFGFEFR
ncbi:MAG: DUF3426 domain-containing protein [Pseudomonas sp.]